MRWMAKFAIQPTFLYKPLSNVRFYSICHFSYDGHHELKLRFLTNIEDALSISGVHFYTTARIKEMGSRDLLVQVA